VGGDWRTGVVFGFGNFNLLFFNPDLEAPVALAYVLELVFRSEVVPVDRISADCLLLKFFNVRDSKFKSASGADEVMSRWVCQVHVRKCASRFQKGTPGDARSQN
jgi:hypothetical protein